MKRNNTKWIICTILTCWFCYRSFSQTQTTIKLDEPIVGQPCPDFTFDKIDFYSKNKACLKDFRGKWLLIDFWSKNCSGCIASLPTISKEQKEFRDQIQFLMVTYEDENKGNEHRPMFANFHNKLHLTMPSAFNSSIVEKWNVGTMPHIVIIDPNGIVRAITVNAHSDQLRDLLAGKNPQFIDATYNDDKEKIGKFKYNPALPFGVYGNGGADTNFLFRSFLTRWDRKMDAQESNSKMIHSEHENQVLKNKGRFELIKYSIGELYFCAYTGNSISVPYHDTAVYGKYWPLPILEVKDTATLYKNNVTGDRAYCYSMSVPTERATKELMMQVMQNDLKNYFGYEVSVEERKMPYWRVVATEEAKKNLRPLGGRDVQTSFGKGQGFEATNIPIEVFIESVHDRGHIKPEPVVNETGIQGNIHVAVHWFINDFNSIKAALQVNGLDIVKGEKLIKCIVIRDPKPSTAQLNPDKTN